MAVNKTSLSAGEIIRAILLTDPDVKSRVKQVFPIAAGDAELPYIHYRRTSISPDPVKNTRHEDAVYIEVTCCAGGYEESVEIAEAVRGALDCRQAEYGGLRMRSCVLSDSDENYEGDAFIQILIFRLKI